MSDRLLEAISAGVRIYDLGRPMEVGMPQSPNHPAYTHSLVVRHGDAVRDQGLTTASDIIILGTHVGTHMDALSHVAHRGLLHNRIDALEAQAGGRFSTHGIDEVAPAVCRGVLLDIPALLGLVRCEPGFEVLPEHCQAALARQQVRLDEGNIALVRTGWGQLWDEPEAYVGWQGGVPGPGEAASKWLADRGVRAVGSDTIAYEHLAPGAGHASLPAHRLLLVERGINIIETLMLEELAAENCSEFTLVVAPLHIVGGTGAPTRPIAIVSADRTFRSADATEMIDSER